MAHPGAFLLFSSDRAGALQVFRMELSTGRQQQLTQAEALDPASPALLGDDRSLCYFDGPSLKRLSLRQLREKEIYRVPDGWSRAGQWSLSRDGSHGAFVEVRGGTYRLRLVKTTGKATTLVEGTQPLGDPRLRTRRDGVLYRQGADGLWMTSFEGPNNRKLPVAPGRLGAFVWSPDGKSVFYLQEPALARAPTVLREFRLAGGADRLVAETSRFVRFSVNGDASVFVGASGSQGAPYILLLLRSTRRELALCEHRAGDPAQAAPVFSPDSQRVYFQSDREGRWAIYGVPVDRLVERTEARP